MLLVDGYVEQGLLFGSLDPSNCTKFVLRNKTTPFRFQLHQFHDSFNSKLIEVKNADYFLEVRSPDGFLLG